MLGACALRLAVRCCTLPVVDSQYKSPTRIGSSSPPHHKPCHCTQSKQFPARPRPVIRTPSTSSNPQPTYPCQCRRARTTCSCASSTTCSAYLSPLANIPNVLHMYPQASHRAPAASTRTSNPQPTHSPAPPTTTHTHINVAIAVVYAHEPWVVPNFPVF